MNFNLVNECERYDNIISIDGKRIKSPTGFEPYNVPNTLRALRDLLSQRKTRDSRDSLFFFHVHSVFEHLGCLFFIVASVTGKWTIS